MTAAASALLAQLTAVGCRVALRSDGQISLRPSPPGDLLALAKQHRDALVALLAPTTPARAIRPPSKAHQGAVPGDPSPPAVHPDATLTLARLELAATGPILGRYGSLTLAYPKRVPPELWAEAQRHQAHIVALLAYRAKLEALWPT